MENLNATEIIYPTSKFHFCLHPHERLLLRQDEVSHRIHVKPRLFKLDRRTLLLCTGTFTLGLPECVSPLAVLLWVGISAAAGGPRIRGPLLPTVVVDCVKGWNRCGRGFFGTKTPSHDSKEEALRPSIGQVCEPHQFTMARYRTQERLRISRSTTPSIISPFAAITWPQ